MPGGHYVALSGMRARLDQLDRLSEDLANASTAGFKGERTGNADVPRSPFHDALDTAIDVSIGHRRLDMRRGTVVATGRELDIAVQGEGFLSVQTAEGVRYTRNGHLTRTPDGTLTTPDGAVVLGESGPLKVGPGDVQIDNDGTVRVGKEEKGKLAVVEFSDPSALERAGGSLLRAPDTMVATPVEDESVTSGAIEQSNVSVVERIGELTELSRNFEALQKALSVLMNDVDGRSIESLGRR